MTKWKQCITKSIEKNRELNFKRDREREREREGWQKYNINKLIQKTIQIS